MNTAADLLNDAIAAMEKLHASMVPDERAEDAIVPPAAVREFVDAHARLLFERKRIDAGLSMTEVVEDLRSVLRWEAHRMGAVSSGTLESVISRLEQR